MMHPRYRKSHAATIAIAAVACTTVGFVTSAAAIEPQSLWHCMNDALDDIDWRTRVLNVLLPDSTSDTSFRCVVIPAFEPEWVIIADCEADPSANLELRVAKENVWFANMVPMPTVGHRAVGGWSDSPVPIEIEVRQASLSSDTCLALRDLWSTVLKRPIHWAGGGVDGTEYVFFAGTGVNESCGETWSPRDGTFLHRLVEVVDDLNHLALDEDLLSRRKRDAQLRERAMRLTKDQLTRERKTK